MAHCARPFGSGLHSLWLELPPELRAAIRSMLDAASALMLGETCADELANIKAGNTSYQAARAVMELNYTVVAAELLSRTPRYLLTPQSLEYAASCGQWEVFRQLWDILTESCWEFGPNLLIAAASGQCWKIFDFATTNRPPHQAISPAAAGIAGKLGDINLLQRIATEEDIKRTDFHIFITNAAHAGQNEVIDYANSLGVKFTAWDCANAAAGGHLATIRHLRAYGCPWDLQTPRKAARFGYLDVLHYAVEHHCPHDLGNLLEYAAEGSHIHIVQYLLNEGAMVPRGAHYIGLTSGSLEVLKLLVAHGAAFAQDCVDLAASTGSVEVVEYLLSLGYEWRTLALKAALAAGSIPLVQFCLDHSCLITETAYRDAEGWPLVKYLHEVAHVPPLTSGVLIRAAIRDSELSVVHYLVRYGLDTFDGSTLVFAAACGGLSAIKFLHQSGAAWSTVALVQAAKKGYSASLKYLMDHAPPNALEEACIDLLDLCIAGGHLHCVELLRTEYKLPLTPQHYMRASEGAFYMFKYMHGHGCPGDADNILKNSNKRLSNDQQRIQNYLNLHDNPR